MGSKNKMCTFAWCTCLDGLYDSRIRCLFDHMICHSELKPLYVKIDEAISYGAGRYGAKSMAILWGHSKRQKYGSHIWGVLSKNARMAAILSRHTSKKPYLPPHKRWPYSARVA